MSAERDPGAGAQPGADVQAEPAAPDDPAGEADDVYSEEEEGQLAERLASLGYLE